MLVLTRRVGQEIVIDGNIRLFVVSIHGARVRLGIRAPQSVHVTRQESHAQKKELGKPGRAERQRSPASRSALARS